MVGPADSFVVWDLPNLTELMLKLYDSAADVEQYMEAEDDRSRYFSDLPEEWREKSIALFRDFHDRRIMKKTDYESAHEALDDEFGVHPPPQPRQPDNPHCELKEFGFDWNHSEAFVSTEMNGTHGWHLAVRKDDEEWMDADATARMILEISRDYPGWRYIYCEGSHKSIRFDIYGGWRNWRGTDPLSAC